MNDCKYLLSSLFGSRDSSEVIQKLINLFQRIINLEIHLMFSVPSKICLKHCCKLVCWPTAA
jgi:hypothetical protein